MSRFFLESPFRQFKQSRLRARRTTPDCPSGFPAYTWRNHNIIASDSVANYAYPPGAADPFNDGLWYAEGIGFRRMLNAGNNFFDHTAQPIHSNAPAQPRGKWRVDVSRHLLIPKRSITPAEDHVYVSLFRNNLAGLAARELVRVGANNIGYLEDAQPDVPAGASVTAATTPENWGGTWSFPLTGSPGVVSDFVIVPETREFCSVLFQTDFQWWPVVSNMPNPTFPFTPQFVTDSSQVEGIDSPGGYVQFGWRDPGTTLAAGVTTNGSWDLPAPPAGYLPAAAAFTTNPFGPLAYPTGHYAIPGQTDSTFYLEYSARRMPLLACMWVATVNFTGIQRRVKFTDLTVIDAGWWPGLITSWTWDFGDGGISHVQHPVHDYSAAGDYTVTLTVTNQANDSSTSTAVVVVS